LNIRGEKRRPSLGRKEKRSSPKKKTSLKIFPIQGRKRGKGKNERDARNFALTLARQERAVFLPEKIL